MSTVLDWIANHGYGAIFLLLTLGIVGLPAADETLLIYAGYLISREKLEALPAWGCALAGSWCGISLSYAIGRTLGLGLVHRLGRYFGSTYRLVERAHRWFEHAGHWALFGGYFIMGVRHFTAIVAGTSKLEFRAFMLYAWTGGLLWVTGFIVLGYSLGDHWERIAASIHVYLAYGSVAVVVAGAYYWWSRSKRA